MPYEHAFKQNKGGGVETIMFKVIGETRERQNAIIAKVSKVDVMAGFLLAVVRFEWTFRRAVIALGAKPVKEIKDDFRSNGHGKDNFKMLWRKHVVNGACEGAPALACVLNEWAMSNLDVERVIWGRDFTKAMNIRHLVVHGANCSSSDDFLKTHTATFLRAADILCLFAERYGKSVFSVLRRRREATRNSLRPISNQKAK